MITNHQIKKEIYTIIGKGPYGPALNDTVNEAALKKSLFSKYNYDLSADEINSIADELVDTGNFHWDDDGKLALSANGVTYLENSR